MGPADLPRRRLDIAFEPMPDGSGVVVDTLSGSSYALNATAAAVWELCDGRRAPEAIAAALLERYEATPEQVRSSVAELLVQLRELGVLEPAGSETGPAADLPHRCFYELMGFRVEVASNSADFSATLDRLNAEFRAGQTRQPDAIYKVIAREAGRRWEITYRGQELRPRDSLLEAASFVEWHICDRAIERRHDLLHVHGAALAGHDCSLLMPGGFGIGKTTFALALALRGLRLLSDDVVFIRPDGWRPEPFPRSFHIRDDMLARLEPLGLRYVPEDHIGSYLCSTVVGPWERTPGPPLRYVIFPRLLPEGPLSLEPISDAEAAVELMRYSKNLRRFPRFGLDLLPRLLEQSECYVLRRNDDIAAAARLITGLVTEGASKPG